MRGIILIDAVKLFGLKHGFTFWFDWSFIHPLQRFIFLHITHKPYCLECGWYCGKNCNGQKLTKKQDILNHWEKIKEEMNTIEKGKDGNCVYCGEEKGTEIIPNPNMSELSEWLVCKDCKEIIHYQQKLSLSQIIGDEKLASEAVNKLDEIAKRTKKPIMVAEVRKTKEGYKTASIEFTGKK